MYEKASKERPQYRTRNGASALYRGVCNGHQYIILWERLGDVMPCDEEHRDVVGWSAVLNVPGDDPCVDYPATCVETFKEAEEAVWDFAMDMAPPPLR